MKIGFGKIYLAFVIIGIIYELAIHSFRVDSIVNYVLTGFLTASGIFIVFYIVAKIVLFARRKLSEKAAELKEEEKREKELVTERKS